MHIRQALMTYLLAHPGLAALVSTRIHYNSVPQGSAYPVVCIIPVSDVKDHLLSGQCTLERPIYQFTAYATTDAGAVAVADQLKAALSDYHGTMSGIQVQKIELQNELFGEFSLNDGTLRLNTADLEYEVCFVKE